MIHQSRYLLLDDTSWQRQAKTAEAVSKVWSSTAGSVRPGMQVVLLVWTHGHRKIPVGMRLWQKGGKSKVALAKELIQEAADRGLCPKYVLFDSWYASKGILSLLSEMGWKYVARIKSNPLLDGAQIRRKWRQRFGQAKGHLKQVTSEV